MRLAGFHGLQYMTAKMQLAPGQHSFQLDYSQSPVPNQPDGNNAALLLQARPVLWVRSRSASSYDIVATPGLMRR